MKEHKKLTLLSALQFRFFLSFFLAAPSAHGRSQAGNQTHTTAVPRAMAVTLLDP